MHEHHQQHTGHVAVLALPVQLQQMLLAGFIYHTALKQMYISRLAAGTH
jgi:hypothetical protein